MEDALRALQQPMIALLNQNVGFPTQLRSQLTIAEGLQELLGAITTVLNRAQAPTRRMLVVQKGLGKPPVLRPDRRLLRVGQESRELRVMCVSECSWSLVICSEVACRFLSVSCRCCTRCFLCTQLCNLDIDLLLDLCFYLLRNIRALVEQVNVHDCNSTHRRALTNRQQWFAHKGLDISNSEIDSPTVATFNAQSFARFDNFSSGCAECEIHITMNPLLVCEALVPRCLSCTSVTPNLDPFRLPHFYSMQLEILFAGFVESRL